MHTKHCCTCCCLTPKMGARYEVDGEIYMVAKVTGDKYLLVNLESGNRWDDVASLDGIAKQLVKGDFDEIA